MSLKETIEIEYKNALKSKDKTKISTYRLILSSIKDLDISNRSGPNKKKTDDDRCEYGPIQDLQRPFPVCTALSVTLGDRDPAACLLHDALQLQARIHRGAPATGDRGCGERAVGGRGSA